MSLYSTPNSIILTGTRRMSDHQGGESFVNRDIRIAI